MRYAEGKGDNKIPVSWEIAMASKRNKGTKKFVPANKKYPGDEKLLSMLETMDTADIAAEFSVTRHTVLNWIKRNGFKEAAKKVRFVQPVKKVEVEDAPARDRSPEGWLMELWAKKRLSKAQGINGWRWTRPWLASEA
jgi:hypothetical protein